ncbi:MAG: hypothetical protein K2L87_04625 [Clostridiales bacterium]|nr:hypothetical protein [Clostridiales bacterium]
MRYTVVMSNSAIKKYKFQFSALIYAMFGIGLALAGAGIGLTIWRIITQGADGVYQWLQHILILFMSGLFTVIIISMLIKSQYVLYEDKLVLQFGLIRTKYELKKIYSIHLFKGAGKLAVYFDDFKTKYVMVVVKESWYDDFVKTLLDLNPNLGFYFSTAEEEEEIKRNNKKK